MYEVLFHILGLAILEIIFYFEYIGPMETKVFHDSINNAIKSITNKPTPEDKEKIKLYIQNDPLINILLGNVTMYENNVESEYKKSIEDRKIYNDNLYDICLKYWILSFFILLLIILSVFLINYLIKINNSKSLNYDINEIDRENINEIEMTTIQNDTLNGINYENINSPTRRRLVRMRIDSSSNEELLNDNDDNKEAKEKKESIIWKIIKLFFYYISTFAGILIFEYFFFNNIVLKYKITTNIEIEYLVFKQLEYYIY